MLLYQFFLHNLNNSRFRALVQIMSHPLGLFIDSSLDLDKVKKDRYRNYQSQISSYLFYLVNVNAGAVLLKKLLTLYFVELGTLFQEVGFEILFVNISATAFRMTINYNVSISIFTTHRVSIPSIMSI